MNRNRLRRSLSLAALLVGGLLLVSLPAHAQQTCVTAQCHASLLEAGVVHPATESCDSCHEAVDPNHPQAGKKTFKLTEEPPQLCFECHDPFGSKKDVHEPVKEGMCTTCHDPHSAPRAKLLKEPVGELCGSCHDQPTSFPHLHGPVSAGACTACHTPHESDVKPLLLKAGQDLCFGCHGAVKADLQKKNVHPALEDGCTTCHQPHGSKQTKLLSEKVPELCFECHDDIGDTVKHAASPHAPVTSEKACVTCHSPHATDSAKLLVAASQKELCLSCHKDVVTAQMTFLHQPVAAGKCTACHDPHGGKYPKLLDKEFPAGDYVAYTDKEFELCFSCHNRDLVRYPDTSFATNFRDGARNLHYLHVNKAEKGRSCILCHNVHGASNPKLIAEGVPFGQWKLPLNFKMTATGGSCAPGCHKPQSYDRAKPVSSAPAPASR